MYYRDMKISKISNIIFFTIAFFSFGGVFVSCGSTKVEPSVAKESKSEESTPVVAPAVEEPAPAVEEPAPAVVEEPTVEEPVDDEYSRSVGDVQVSRDTFLDDKEKVLQIISELDAIMKDPGNNKSYSAWLGYVDQESINYWKLRKNLQKAEKRLPVRGIKLQSLQDYFKQVFVPARRGREVTEIRYISDTYIKAIQVQEKQDIVYYYFNKIGGKWMVHIPPIDN